MIDRPWLPPDVGLQKMYTRDAIGPGGLEVLVPVHAGRLRYVCGGVRDFEDERRFEEGREYDY
jgi:hypothetical protein